LDDGTASVSANRFPGISGEAQLMRAITIKNPTVPRHNVILVTAITGRTGAQVIAIGRIISFAIILMDASF
jgi:hypothetical protein